jgi:hypothetical protein
MLPRSTHFYANTHSTRAAAVHAEIKSGIIRTDAYVPEDQIERLKRDGLTIEVIRDETAAIRAAQEQVGKGNRFKGENRVPRGLGRKIKDGRDVPQH